MDYAGNEPHPFGIKPFNMNKQKCEQKTSLLFRLQKIKNDRQSELTNGNYQKE